MAFPGDPERHVGTVPEPYGSLEAVDGVARPVIRYSELIPWELKQDPTYPEAVYEVNREAPEAVILDGANGPPTKKAGISKCGAWLIIAVLLLTIAAIGGGVGGALAEKYKKNASTSPTSTSTPSSTLQASATLTSSLALPPSATTSPKVQVLIGTSISSINWGAGPSFQMKVYFQGNDSFIYESSFAAGKWTASSPKKIVQAKLLTPIASMFYPPGGIGNVSITICFLSENNMVTEYIYNGQNWDSGPLGISVPVEALNSSALSGTLLRQPQPSNGTHVWEPYVLYFQQKDYSIRELVQTATGWELSTYWGTSLSAYKGSPIAVIGGDNGYSLQLFFLRANDTQLLGFNATRETLNANSYDHNTYVTDTRISRAWPTRPNYNADGRFGDPWTDVLRNSSNCSALSGLREPRLSFSSVDDITAATPSWLQCMHAGSSTVNSYNYKIPQYTSSNGEVYTLSNVLEWMGPQKNDIGFGGRGLAAHARSSIALFYDNGAGQWPCSQGYVYQNVEGNLDTWGFACYTDSVYEGNGTLPQM